MKRQEIVPLGPQFTIFPLVLDHSSYRTTENPEKLQKTTGNLEDPKSAPEGPSLYVFLVIFTTFLTHSLETVRSFDETSNLEGTKHVPGR